MADAPSAPAPASESARSIQQVGASLIADFQSGKLSRDELAHQFGSFLFDRIAANRAAQAQRAAAAVVDLTGDDEDAAEQTSAGKPRKRKAPTEAVEAAKLTKPTGPMFVASNVGTRAKMTKAATRFMASILNAEPTARSHQVAPSTMTRVAADVRRDLPTSGSAHIVMAGGAINMTIGSINNTTFADAIYRCAACEVFTTLCDTKLCTSEKTNRFLCFRCCRRTSFKQTKRVKKEKTGKK